MWFPSFQSINFGKVVHTYYRSKEAVNLCRRSSFRGIIWWDFVRKKYPEIIKKRKERIYAIMLADSLESLVGKIISYNTCILFLALIFFISRTYWVLLDDAFVPFFWAYWMVFKEIIKNQSANVHFFWHRFAVHLSSPFFLFFILFGMLHFSFPHDPTVVF